MGPLRGPLCPLAFFGRTLALFGPTLALFGLLIALFGHPLALFGLLLALFGRAQFTSAALKNFAAPLGIVLNVLVSKYALN